MTPSFARLDSSARLIEADARIALLQAEAGGDPAGPFAVPALASLVRLALRLKTPIARGVDVGAEGRDISMWVQIRPDGDGLRLAIVDWTERTPRIMDPDRNVAMLMAADAAIQGSWDWQVDSRMRFRAPEADAGRLGHVAPVAGETLTGYFVLTDEGLEPGAHMPVVDALARRAPFIGQTAQLRADRAVRYVLCAVPLFDITGHLMGYRGSALRTDHDESTLTAGEAEDAPTVFGPELGRRLDYALRQPLGRIIANASTISGQFEGPLRKEYADYAQDIALAGRHLMELVDDLADLQAIERPGFEAAREEVDLADLSRRAAGLLSVRAAARGIEISTPAIGEKALACGEYRRVLQILVNLVGNAVRYSPDGSKIWLRVDSENGRSCVIVADQGRGIDPADHERIFQRFERLTTDESGGSGLGLYISRRLARAMGGDVVLDSALGAGARFMLDLPAWT